MRVVDPPATNVPARAGALAASVEPVSGIINREA